MAYAAELDEQDVAIRVIVGTAEWATKHLGGQWVDSPKAGAGWLYLNGQIVPPQPHQSWIYDNGWQPPIPMPDGDWMWDEDTLSWVEYDGTDLP